MSSSPEKPDHNKKEKKCKWIITIHSQKGGVGKTLIALYLARRMAEKPRHGLNRRTVLIDADLTGTSLCHAVDMLAPRPSNGNGRQLDPLTSAETRERLREWSACPGEIGRSRQSCSPGPPLWVLNDYLFCDPLIFKNVFKKMSDRDLITLHVWDLLWSWDTTRRKVGEENLDVDLANLRIIPSSGFHSHVSLCLPHIYKEDVTRYLDHRLTELVWQLWHPRQRNEKQEDEAFDAVIIDCPPTLSGISAVALNLHGSLENRMRKSPNAQQEAIIHLALFISSADVQDVVGLWQGLDSLLADEAGPVFDPVDEEQQKKNQSVMLDEVRFVMNRVPDTPVARDSLAAAGKKDGEQDSIDSQPATGRIYNLKDSPDALQYFRACAESFLQFQSNSLKDPTTVDWLFRLEDQTFIIPFNKACSEQFVVRRATYGIIEPFETLFNAVKEAKPRARQ